MFEPSRTGNSTLPARFFRTPNQSLAKHNRKSSQIIENNHQRPKSIASFCRVFCDYGGNGAQQRQGGSRIYPTKSKATAIAEQPARVRHYERHWIGIREALGESEAAPAQTSPNLSPSQLAPAERKIRSSGALFFVGSSRRTGGLRVYAVQLCIGEVCR
jgi:hypothetical protein